MPKRPAPAVPEPAGIPVVTAAASPGNSVAAAVAVTSPRSVGRSTSRPALAAPANTTTLVAERQAAPGETPTAATPVEPVIPATDPAVPASVGPAATPASAAATSIPALRGGLYRAPSAALPAPAAATAALASGPAASAVAVTTSLTSGTANPIGDFINGVLLMIRRTFFNQAPSASPKQAMVRPDGQVWGFISGSDPEGDTITYALNQGPKYGTVAIDQYGVYHYTPGAGFTGTDSFTATIDSPGFHINLRNLFNPFASQKSVVTVTVNSKVADPAGTVVDTFTGSAGSQPNPSLWTINTGSLIDDGLQTYTNSTDNVRLDGQGHLVIQAQNTPNGYTSGEVITQGKLDMTSGTMVARIKFPAGQGIWPAFWMLGSTYSQATWNASGPTGWPGCGEIDVMELVNTGTTYHVALHGPETGGTDYYGGVNASGQVVGTTGPIADLSADYHDYWVMRDTNVIVVGVDGTMLGTFTPTSLPVGGQWVFNTPMYAILNVAVGGPWPGPPDATTPWPSTMLVDSFKYTPLT